MDVEYLPLTPSQKIQEQYTGPDYLTALPPEIRMKIMWKLDSKSLINARQSNHLLNDITQDPIFKKTFCGFSQVDHNDIIDTQLPGIFGKEIGPLLKDFLEKQNLYLYADALHHLLSSSNREMLTLSFQEQLLSSFPFQNTDGSLLPDNINKFFLIASYASFFFAKKIPKLVQAHVIKTLTTLPGKGPLAERIGDFETAIKTHRHRLFTDEMGGFDQARIMKALATLPGKGPLAERIGNFATAIKTHRHRLLYKKDGWI